jgi:uncharacterized protein
MRVGVTGASGLIGTALVEALHERGDDVVEFRRPSSQGSADNLVRWDPARSLLDESDLRRVGGLDSIVNLAGAGIGDRRWTNERRLEIRTSRVAATALIGHAINELPGGVAFIANASAVGWYGSRGDEVLDETSSRGEGFLADVCAAWEDAAIALASGGAPVARLRSGVVLSTRGGALKKQLPLFRYGLGGRLGSGRQWLSPITLADEIAAIVWVIDHHLEGPINLVAPTPLTNRNFTKYLATALHRPAVLIAPATALRVSFGGEMADELLLASQRVLPQRLLASGFSFSYPDMATALSEVLATG